MPLPDACFASGGSSGSLGCSDDQSNSAERVELQANSPPEVEVIERSYTDNYEFVVLESTNTQALVFWLQENGYNVSDNMTPVMEVYNQEGMTYLALKLRDGRAVSDITPIRMTYRTERPMIPIQLTAVGAQPYMGIRVFILGREAYGPQNFEETMVSGDEIVFDVNGRTSYFAWVARKVDERGGHLFVTEYRAEFDLREDYRNDTGPVVLSRFYTRMSPEHMDLDPVFTPNPAGQQTFG